MDQFKTVQRLGLGACGAVYLVQHHNTKRLFALKKIEIDDRRKTRTLQAVLKEASILSGLKHPHIVAFHDSFVHDDQQHVCIIQDYCDGGTLADKIQEAANKKSPLPEEQIMQWFIQILMAVQYIHSKKVLHRDLKTENVFLTKNSVVKIGDFGISKILDSTIDVAKTVVGTPSYLSPELCQDIPYNSKSDIWALGCLLYEMCALRPPFDGNSLISLFFKIVKAEFEPVPAHYSAGVQEIINTVLVKAPEDRPSASAILNLPFVKGHLSSFIQQTESLRKQRTAHLAPGHRMPESSEDGSLLKPVAASPRTARRRAGEATPRLKCSPLTNKFQPPQETDRTDDTKPVVAPDETRLRAQPEDTEANSEYSDDFDESSDSEIEEDIAEEKGVAASGAASEEEAQYADDFEEYDSAEELEEVLHQAREAQDLVPADDYFEDCQDEAEDDMAETLTENSFIKSHLRQVGKNRGEDSVSACGFRPEEEPSDQAALSWKSRTFPNS
ncbi:uncharacterized protein LOC143286410 [Babylonia areolata]|uniref:uncharacterized protein LOC143286410 n=1 Tax=Babylonia areolata TaxID=304850 RepID=UPI003FCF0538